MLKGRPSFQSGCTILHHSVKSCGCSAHLPTRSAARLFILTIPGGVKELIVPVGCVTLMANDAENLSLYL